MSTPRRSPSSSRPWSVAAPSCRSRRSPSVSGSTPTSPARTCAACGGCGRPRRHLLGRPNTMPRVSEVEPAARGGAAGPVEVWAARAWNVFNEGRPFSIVYPLLVLLAAAPLGLAPEGPLGLALAGRGRLARSSCRASPSRFAAGRCSGSPRWRRCRCSSRGGRRRCSRARSPATLFFTVVVWGSVYYHLRTGAPWTNGLRFWRLVLTNSDPTSGNALEQLPKLLIALSAGTLLAEEAGAGLTAAGGRRRGDHRSPRRPRRALVRAPPAALSGASAARRPRRRRSPGAST